MDPPGTTPDNLLTRIEANLSAGLPAIFGFPVYNSYTQSAINGKIPFPTTGKKIAGSHAIMAVGYDDTVNIKNSNKGGSETSGAILIRNSWGTAWRMAGYGWLPHEYVLKGVAQDWWSLLKSKWVDTMAFKA